MDKEALSETIYDQLDRGQIRDFISELTGDRPVLTKPDAAEALVDAMEDLTVRARFAFWTDLVAEFDDWKTACDDLDIPRKKESLRTRLLGKEIEPTSAPRLLKKVKPKARSQPRPSASSVCVGGDEHIPALVRLVEAATDEVVLVAYVLGPGFARVEGPLQDAVARGVGVRLMLDGRDTKSGCGRKNRKLAASFPDGFDVAYGRVHAKLAIVDQRFVLLGSSNLDHASSDVYQANVELDSTAIASSLLESLDDIVECD